MLNETFQISAHTGKGNLKKKQKKEIQSKKEYLGQESSRQAPYEKVDVRKGRLTLERRTRRTIYKPLPDATRPRSVQTANLDPR